MYVVVLCSVMQNILLLAHLLPPLNISGQGMNSVSCFSTIFLGDPHFVLYVSAVFVG